MNGYLYRPVLPPPKYNYPYVPYALPQGKSPPAAVCSWVSAPPVRPTRVFSCAPNMSSGGCFIHEPCEEMDYAMRHSENIPLLCLQSNDGAEANEPVTARYHLIAARTQVLQHVLVYTHPFIQQHHGYALPAGRRVRTYSESQRCRLPSRAR